MKQLLIKNGIIIEKGAPYHMKPYDIYIKEGRIQQISEHIMKEDVEVLDLQGSYLSAGMIDIHVHSRKEKGTYHAEDVDKLAVYRGVTTVIECGSVCIDDAAVFAQGVTQCHARHYGLLSGHGEDGFGTTGTQDIARIREAQYKEAMEAFPALFLGLKVAASQTITNDKGYALVKHAKDICTALHLPLTVHVGSFPPDPCGLVEFLGCGDVITHTYHGKEISLFHQNGEIKESFARARERGVLFDVGHGSASFSWMVYDKARRKGFYPDLISTDLRKSNMHGPAYSLPIVMSKLMNLGMSLEDAVDKVTSKPAEVYHLQQLGSIKEGYLADFSSFDIIHETREVEDCCQNIQVLNHFIRPLLTIVSKGGSSELYQCDKGEF